MAAVINSGHISLVVRLMPVRHRLSSDKPEPAHIAVSYTHLMQAVFTIDGKQLQFTFPAGTKWERSYRNIYDIVLGNNGLVIGGADGSGVTIEPWTDDVKGEIQLVPVI